MAEDAPGEEDAQVLAVGEARIVVTFDRDFDARILRRGYAASGVVLLRLQAGNPDGILAQFERVWPRLIVAAPGHFVVATNTKIRVHRLSPTE